MAEQRAGVVESGRKGFSHPISPDGFRPSLLMLTPAPHQTREQQILAFLAERRGEKLPASTVASELQTDVENVRATLKRLHARRAIAKGHEMRTYKVGNAVCRHKALLWYVPL